MHHPLLSESPEKSDVVSSMPRAHDFQGSLDLRRVEHLLPLSRAGGRMEIETMSESASPRVQAYKHEMRLNVPKESRGEEGILGNTSSSTLDRPYNTIKYSE